MHWNTTPRRLALLLVATVLLVGAGTTGALAADDSSDDTVEIGSQDIVISDTMLTIGNANVSADGVEERDIEHQTYHIDHAEAEFDGLTVTWNDTTYNVCHVDIVIDDVGIVVENLSIN